MNFGANSIGGVHSLQVGVIVARGRCHGTVSYMVSYGCFSRRRSERLFLQVLLYVLSTTPWIKKLGFPL